MTSVKLSDVLFFVVRHGQTAGNAKKTYRGWSNGPDAQLNGDGQHDADEAGKYLASIGAPVELVIVDSLDRTVETGERLAASFPNARMETVRALHPLNVGDWTGEPKDEHPVDAYLRDTKKRIPGGATLDEFNAGQQRVWKSIFDLIETFPAGRMAVVVHGSNVAYLFNHVFNQDEERIGYEGLVDPGGVIASTPAGLVPLTKVRGEKKKDSEVHPKPTYPADHQPGVRVPKGGSSCATCEYLGKDGKSCTSEYFIRWNGSEKLPYPADEYCSDWYSPAKGAL